MSNQDNPLKNFIKLSGLGIQIGVIVYIFIYFGKWIDLYLNNKINYNQIIPYIMEKIDTNKNEKDFKNYSSIINFLDNLKIRYDGDTSK